MAQLDYQPTSNKKTSGWIWFVLIIVAVLIVAVIAFAVSNSIPLTAQAQVNVESDVVASNLRLLNGTEKITQINWGVLEPNKTYTRTFTVACDNTVQVTADASEWNPQNATDYLTFNYTCTYMGIVTPYSDINITFTLSVAEAAPSGNFSFTITVVGNQASDRFVQTYNGWQIYVTEHDEFFDDTIYIAIQPDTKRVILYGVLDDLKAKIDEAMR